MFLGVEIVVIFFGSFPRVCGDVPTATLDGKTFAVFSPRMRGCSGKSHVILHSRRVFPAYAGMFRHSAKVQVVRRRFPRVCGDVPETIMKPFELVRVFPAYAGMFPLRSVGTRSIWSFPRVCGDVPETHVLLHTRRWFSPRMRGCSVCPMAPLNACGVFPAYAGMFRRLENLRLCTNCFPRVCGDVPLLHGLGRVCFLFSPRMRGCSPA